MELDEMHEAHRLLRQGTGATLAITVSGFPGRIVWTGYARLADVADRTVDNVNFVPQPARASAPSFPALTTIELRLKEAAAVSVDDNAEYGGLALHWQSPFGRMELALYDREPDTDYA
jgi:hypothetical protein